MAKPIVEVRLWGVTLGYLGYTSSDRIATFEYSDQIFKSDFQPSPIVMPNNVRQYRFDDISERTFKGLPGIFSDSLPDTFGNQLIDIYLAEKGMTREEITPLDRLLYVGERGMGALTYHPANNIGSDESRQISLDLEVLSALANEVASRKADIHQALLRSENAEQAIGLIRVGSSAGGARAKALVAISPAGRFLDGTIDHGTDHKYWLLKFDVDENKDRDGKDPKGMTRVEYVYGLIARRFGINLPNIDYVENTNSDDFHFMIERFDWVSESDTKRVKKLHYASWSGLAHAHRDTTGAYSYEQLALLCRQLGLPASDLEEIYKRAVFNIIGRNQDDHTKNTGFIVGKDGKWRLSPAFDLTYSFDPWGKWTSVHQIRLNRKQDNFTRDDLLAFARHCNLTTKKANLLIDKALAAFREFPTLAKEHNIPAELARTVNENLRFIGIEKRRAHK